MAKNGKQWTINNGFFIIADDITGGRYINELEDSKKVKKAYKKVYNDFDKNYYSEINFDTKFSMGSPSHSYQITRLNNKP